MNIINTDHAACDECAQVRRGVRFRLRKSHDNESFLCWEHFRATLNALAASGFLPDAWTWNRRKQAHTCGCYCDRSKIDTHTRTRTSDLDENGFQYGEAVGQSVGPSRIGNWSEAGEAESYSFSRGPTDCR
jgi:hypothetical protein